MKKVYGRGSNIMKQICAHQDIKFHQFTQIQSLRNLTIKNIECGFLQSYFLLNDNQILHQGYIMDNFTTNRILWYYKVAPKFFQLWQRYVPFGKMLGLRNYIIRPLLLNKQLVMDGKNIKKIANGGCSILLLNNQNQVYGIGQNLKGQLGLNNLQFQMKFKQVLIPNLENVVDIACGFQHTLFVTRLGNVYGSGKSTQNQILMYKDNLHTQRIIKQFFFEPVLISKGLRIKKAAGGFTHSIFLSQDNKVYALGSNKKGQCGINSMKVQNTEKVQEVFCYFANHEKILDIKCGFNHTLILTNQNVYFFGCTQHSQYPFPLTHEQNICSPLRIPIKQKPIKIFANFDRSAIITQNNKCYIFGGENLKELSGQGNQLQIIQNLEINKNSEVGLGYMHTLISV